MFACPSADKHWCAVTAGRTEERRVSCVNLRLCCVGKQRTEGFLGGLTNKGFDEVDAQIH